MSVENKLIFPRAFAVAIDDLGWNEGRNMLHDTPPGPYRVGVKRNFTLEDYEFIVKVAETVGVRVQCLFIMSEMDRENVLARYPTTTHLKSRWDNSHRVCSEQIEIMKYVVEKSAFLEFGFHGTGHEYWPEDGVQRRAEWYNMEDRRPWPEDDLRKHIQAFKEIMAQYDLTAAHGHSFPETFVPCAYSYYWNPKGNYSLGRIMSEAGAKYANTDFSQIPELMPPQEMNGGGFDNGVHVINRMNFGNLWYELNMTPKVTIDLQGTDIIESHWANWLAHDAFLQSEATSRWITYYNDVRKVSSRYLAKNTEQLHAQWLYRKYAVITETSSGSVSIDNTKMPLEYYDHDLLGNLVLKLSLTNGQSLSSATLDGKTIPAIFTYEQSVLLYLPPLQAESYDLRYEVGLVEMTDCVVNEGTYNVYSTDKSEAAIDIELKVYGSQTIKVKCQRCTEAISLSVGIKVKSFRYNDNLGIALVDLRGTDFQGSRGRIRLLF